MTTFLSLWWSSLGGVNRPRSKTFEEYEKETDDIWNDEEEDLEGFTHSAELEMVPEAKGLVGGTGRQVPTSHPKGKAGSRSRGNVRYSRVCVHEGIDMLFCRSIWRIENIFH